MFVDEFGGGADEVGDDGVEAGVDLLLRGFGCGDAFRLRDGVQALVMPGQGDRVRQAWGRGGLLAEGGAVPGEVDPFDPTAELLASELLTNAHLHTAGPYALRLRAMETGRLRLAVWDSDPKVPPGFDVLGPQPVETAENGRGLHLVQACADAWGAYVLEGAACAGKLMWAECQ